MLAMLNADAETLARRAAQLAHDVGGDVVETTGRVGGGALPLLELRGPAVALARTPAGAKALADVLRAEDPPLVARIVHDRVIVDPRTLDDAQLADATAVVLRALARLEGSKRPSS